MIFDILPDGRLEVLGASNLKIGNIRHPHWNEEEQNEFGEILLRKIKFDFESFRCLMPIQH